MYANLDRDKFLELLEQLGSEDDAEVLAAARDLTAQLTVAGLGWDDLLTPEPEDSEEEYEYSEEALDGGEDDEESDTEEAVEEPVGEEDIDAELAAVSGEDKTEAEKLIEDLLAQDISEATREELEEYKVDIQEGEFAQMDLKYLRALHARLKA